MFLSHFLDGGFDDHLDLEPPEFDKLEGEKILHLIFVIATFLFSVERYMHY